MQTRGALLLCSSPGAAPLFTWSTKKKFNSPLCHSAQLRCVFVYVRVWYYCHRVVILPCWHGRKASGSQSQLAPGLMDQTCVCMCVNGDTRMSCVCVCVNVFVTDSPSPEPRLSSSCTMGCALKHGAMRWQADRRETMCCNLWGALLLEGWWVIKRKTLGDTAGAQLQATGHWLCVLTRQQTPLWVSDNMGSSVPHTGTDTHSSSFSPSNSRCSVFKYMNFWLKKSNSMLVGEV